MEKNGIKRLRFSGLLKALLLSYFVTMVLLLVLSLLLYKVDLDENKVRMGICGTYITATFAGGFLIGKMEKARKFLWGLLLGMIYFLIILAISAGIYQSVQGGIQMVIAWGLCMAGGMIGGMLS